MNSNQSNILLYLFYFIAGSMLIPAISACSKNGATLSTDNAYLNIINVSQGIGTVNLYANTNRVSTATYNYPTASGYFLLNIADTLLQIRPIVAANVPQVNYLQLQRRLQKNIRYTWFLTGSRADTLESVVTVDSSSVPTSGRGKIRFINLSQNALALNLYANDTLAFANVPYKTVTKYIEVTNGNYTIDISATSAPSAPLKTLTNFSILDGRLYTIYTYGLLGRPSNDSAAFNANFVLNTIPDIIR